MLALLVPGPARAWGALGHQVVAIIAQDRLSPDAVNWIHALYGPGVGLEQVATCADEMRHAPVNCAGSFFVQEDSGTDDWHFIDIPIQDSPDADSLESYCGKGGKSDNCVVDQIRRDLSVLKDPLATLRQKQIALMFVVHFVGDEHQPLHCATDIGPDGADDRGGNEKPVQFNPDGILQTEEELRAMNLHHLWDNIIQTDGAEKSTDPQALAAKLESDINAKPSLDWLEGDFVRQAALESFSLAKGAIYPQYAQDHGRNLGQAYQDAMQPVAYDRLERAGVRLAKLLEDAVVANKPRLE